MYYLRRWKKFTFIYIDDVVKAFDLIFHKGQLTNIYNIGTSLNYLVNIVIVKTVY